MDDTEPRRAPSERDRLRRCIAEEHEIVLSGDDPERPRRRARAATTATVLEALCRVAVKEFGLVGASIAFPPRDSAHVVAAASNDAARRLEEMQFDTAEGPTLEACRLRFPVLVPYLDSSALGRWPGFVQAALKADIHAVFALPLTIGASLFGALTMYRDAAGPLPPPGLRTALVLSDIAVGTLIDGHTDRPVGPGAPHPSQGAMTALSEEALDGQAHVYQAQGIVMSQLQVSLAEAMALMRAYAYTHELTLSTLATAIVDGRVILDDHELP